VSSRPQRSRESLLQALQRDPALRMSESGRTLLRWIGARAGGPGELKALIDAVPPHCVYIVAQVARICAYEWLEVAEHLGESYSTNVSSQETNRQLLLYHRFTTPRRTERRRSSVPLPSQSLTNLAESVEHRLAALLSGHLEGEHHGQHHRGVEPIYPKPGRVERDRFPIFHVNFFPGEDFVYLYDELFSPGKCLRDHGAAAGQPRRAVAQLLDTRVPPPHLHQHRLGTGIRID